MSEELLKAFLGDIESWWPVASGSLCEVRKPCIRPNCHACAKGLKHPAYIFTYREGGRQRCMYVPVDLVPLMRQAIANGRHLEQRLRQMGRALIESYRQKRDRPLRKGKG